MEGREGEEKRGSEEERTAARGKEERTIWLFPTERDWRLVRSEIEAGRCLSLLPPVKVRREGEGARGEKSHSVSSRRVSFPFLTHFPRTRETDINTHSATNASDCLTARSPSAASRAGSSSDRGRDLPSFGSPWVMLGQPRTEQPRPSSTFQTPSSYRRIASALRMPPGSRPVGRRVPRRFGTRRGTSK